MSAALNNITAPDVYSATQGTLSCPGSARVRLLINNQAIFWKRGFQNPGGGGVEYTEPEEFLPPGLYSFDEHCDAIQVRAATPAAQLPEGSIQAQVTIATRTPRELGQRTLSPRGRPAGG
jgi:hypothetical protein